MVDSVSKEKRSHIMAAVRQKDTKPEIIIRSFLHRLGFRYRLHARDLPGKPDLVFPKYKTVLFVNGCFWHGHPKEGCKLARIPKSNVDFWKNKISSNRERDLRNWRTLSDDGWNVVVVWECELKGETYLNELPGLISKGLIQK